MTISQFIDKIPKAELHLHLEGSLEPELMFALAERNKVSIPFSNTDELRKAYNFSCLQDFLDIYHKGTEVLKTSEDFYDLTMAYFKRINEDAVRHTEIMIDFQTHTAHGLSVETVFEGIDQGCRDAEEEYDISYELILSFLRHLPESEAIECLKSALQYKDKIKAVGLASSEVGNPPKKFKRVYEMARDEGFLPVAHAGEEGPPEYIRQAIEDLKIVRIDHGNRCVEDAQLMSKIKGKEMALTMCPLSNTELQVIDDLKEHPLKLLMDQELKVTVNSDDPSYFGGYINDNYKAIQEALSLNKDDIYTLAYNSIEYSFLEDERKNLLLTEVDDFYKSNS